MGCSVRASVVVGVKLRVDDGNAGDGDRMRVDVRGRGGSKVNGSKRSRRSVGRLNAV